MSKYYLAYGSNLNIRQMSHRCPSAIPVGTAIIKDYRLKCIRSLSGRRMSPSDSDLFQPNGADRERWLATRLIRSGPQPALQVRSKHLKK